MTNSPVPYRADVETPQSHELETVQQLNHAFDQILNRTAEDYGHAVRSVHAKSHGVLDGELSVEAGLPPELAQGLFATPGTHKVLIRMSTNAGDVLPDAISLPRGLAMKVFDVTGERLPGSEGTAQDFIMINGKVFIAPTAEKFLGNLKLLAKTTDRLEGTKKAVSATLRGVFVRYSKPSEQRRLPPFNLLRRRTQCRTFGGNLLQRHAISFRQLHREVQLEANCTGDDRTYGGSDCH